VYSCCDVGRSLGSVIVLLDPCEASLRTSWIEQVHAHILKRLQRNFQRLKVSDVATSSEKLSGF
jgi:hypothetical protein